jgi:putative Ca2+/H+ antiporter (TMEM165/GDT1 family)
MTILIGFLPFLIFAVVSTTHGALAGLLAGAVVSAVLTVKAFRNKNEFRILDVGTLILFLALAIYVKLQGHDLSIWL